MRFLDILLVFRLDLGQISFNLVKNEFFNQCFEHFRAYLRLHSDDHSDLGIIRKMFLFLLQKLRIDDANFGQK